VNATPANAKQTVASALALAAAGRIEDAEKLCRDALTERPDDVNLTGLLGAILLKRGQLGEAETRLQQTIGLEPAFAKPHEDLGVLYLQQNRPEDAVPCFENAVKLNAQSASSLHGLATALARCGRQAEAEAVQQQFLALSPAARALAEAAKLFQGGNAGGAEKICGEILSQDPNNLRALRLLAKIASDKQRYAAAEGLLGRVIQLEPDFYLGYSDLGEFLSQRSRFHEAAAMQLKAAQLNPALAHLHCRLGDTLAIVNKPADALQAYTRCLEIEPGNVAALMGRGHMQRILGQRNAAIASYLECTRLHPETGDAWWSLASIKGYEFSDDQRKRMLALLETAESAGHSSVAIHFAVARAFESAGGFDAAWEHYTLGNTARRSNVDYDAVENRRQNDARIAVFDSELLRRLASPPTSETIPVFIVGVPRSGSTLIEQILASHSRVEGCGELPYVIMQSAMLGKSAPDGPRYPEILRQMPPEELQQLGTEYLGHSAAHRRADSAFFTDKMPANFLHVGLIHLMLPQAIIIDARRNPLDACVANYRQLFAQGKNQSYDLKELGEYHLEYLRTMDHWDTVLPGRVLRVEYEQLVGDFEPQVRRILQHCGLEFEAACLNFHQSTRPVNTASSEQVRLPIYTDAIGFWKNFEPHLDELKRILAPVL
jgi:tetratricopeptide (TPR) repeat protein